MSTKNESAVGQQATGTLTDAIIEGRYKVGRLIERRGDVEIYEGQQTLLDRPIVLKIVLPEAEARTELMTRSVREAKALAQLDHPNIVRVLDVGLHEGAVFVARDQVAGETLEELFAKGQRFTWARAKDALTALLGALDHIHAHGLVHRDLCAKNVVASEDTLRIVDFGVVQSTRGDTAEKGRLTAVGAVLGDPRYSSTEQLMGFPTDARSDLYSLGVLIFQAVTGHLPYEAKTPAALLRLQDEPAPSIGTFVELPEDSKVFAQLVQRLIAIDPKGRPASAKEALVALGAARPDTSGIEPITVVEKEPALPPPLWREQAEALRARVEETVEQLTEIARPYALRARSKWMALEPKKRAIAGGASAALALMLVAVAVWPGEPVGVAAVEVEAVAEPAPVPAEITTALADARKNAERRRAEQSLDAYGRVAESAPELLTDKDLRTIGGYLGRKDWLSAPAERTLIRVGANAARVLQGMYGEKTTTPFLRRRIDETLRQLPDAQLAAGEAGTR